MPRTIRKVFRRMRGASLLLPLLLLAPGCVGVWWKAGAGTQELDRDKAACRAEAPAEDGFVACMSERGWWHSPGPGEAKAPGDAALSPPPPVPADPAGAPGTADPSARASGREPVAAPVSEPAVRRKAGPTAVPSAVAPATAASAPAAAAARGASGSSQVFWKFGASARELDRDQAACLEHSGLRVERDSGPRWGESAGFDRCMCARGWRGGSC